jgi:very-short-patch-repair endonuclease
MQHACAHRHQLLAAGLGRGAIRHRLKTQRYRVLRSAVYLIDPARADDWTATMAAILWFGGDAVAGHRSAGSLWGMVDEPPPEPDIVLAGRSAHAQPGMTIHRVRRLDRRDTRWRQDLPVTSPARTIVDLAGLLDVLELENALAVCRHGNLASVREIREAMQRAGSFPGVGPLRRLLDQGGFARTRSYYERKLLRLLAEAGLPRPLMNHRVAGHEVDMAWLDEKLVVEFDSHKFHTDRRAFETDRRRDQDLAAAGYRVIRVTARQIEREPLALIARLATALAWGK